MAALKYWDAATSQWVTLQGGPKGDQGDPGPQGETGPTGSAGPSGVLSGNLADRPANPGYSAAYIAKDSSSPVSVFDGSSWSDVPVNPSNLLVDWQAGAVADVTYPDAVYTTVPESVTNDIIAPGGLLRIYSTFAFALQPLNATNGMNEGLILASSIDGGTTWSGINLIQPADQKATVLMSTVPGGIMVGFANFAPGTTVRFGIRIRVQGSKKATFAIPPRVIVEKI